MRHSNKFLEEYRNSKIEARVFKGPGNKYNGIYDIPLSGKKARVIATNARGWEHVSVSFDDRTPTWEEMCTIKNMFFAPYETVIQFHPAESEYVNHHEYCLHLWKPIDQAIPLPPSELVGFKKKSFSK